MIEWLAGAALVTGIIYHSVGLYRHHLWFKKQRAKK